MAFQKKGFGKVESASGLMEMRHFDFQRIHKLLSLLDEAGLDFTSVLSSHLELKKVEEWFINYFSVLKGVYYNLRPFLDTDTKKRSDFDTEISELDTLILNRTYLKQWEGKEGEDVVDKVNRKPLVSARKRLMKLHKDLMDLKQRTPVYKLAIDTKETSSTEVE